MTYKEIASMIQSIGLPFTYDHFPNNEAPLPPYIVFNFPQNADFGADNTNYVSIDVINIELYTSEKDFATESEVEAVLKANGFYYQKSEAYITREHLFQISYVLQSIINKELENGE